MTNPTFEYRIEIARILNRGGLSAAPLERLPLLSIFDDDEYENYDLDVVTPRRRLRIASALKKAGFRQATGRVFQAPGGGAPVVFPRPLGLGSDPSRPPGEVLDQGGSVVLVTPTQAVLLYLHRFGDQGAGALEAELEALVREQPANLAKVGEWARAAGAGGTFDALKGKLAAAQAEGTDLRKKRLFRSQLPR